jgi:dTDP-glucose 4,6-dehydratase
MMKNILVTGGLGFIGSHFVKYLLSKSPDDCRIYNMDKMGYGSNTSNLSEYQDDPRYFFIKGDINDIMSKIDKLCDVEIVVNIAAETHVDRSIAFPDPFMHSNYDGTFRLLEYARKNNVLRFIQVSTDEVYGEAKENNSFNEDDPINPTNPYSASKASADLLVRAYCNTYGIKGVITRCTNNFGPNQFPEKLLPKTIIMILGGMPISLYGDGRQIRDWLYVQNHVEAIYQVMLKARAAEIYNISTNNLLKNIDIVEKICSIVKQRTGKETKIKLTNDRPGHDRRYSLDSTKIRNEIGWSPRIDFDKALDDTITWYLENNQWWAPLLNESILHQQPWALDWSKKDNIHV